MSLASLFPNNWRRDSPFWESRAAARTEERGREKTSLDIFEKKNQPHAKKKVPRLPTVVPLPFSHTRKGPFLFSPSTTNPDACSSSLGILGCFFRRRRLRFRGREGRSLFQGENEAIEREKRFSRLCLKKISGDKNRTYSGTARNNQYPAISFEKAWNKKRRYSVPFT